MRPGRATADKIDFAKDQLPKPTHYGIVQQKKKRRMYQIGTNVDKLQSDKDDRDKEQPTIEFHDTISFEGRKNRGFAGGNVSQTSEVPKRPYRFVETTDC